MNNQNYAGGGYITNDDSHQHNQDLSNFSNNGPMQYLQNQDPTAANTDIFNDNPVPYAMGGEVKKTKKPKKSYNDSRVVLIKLVKEPSCSSSKFESSIAFSKNEKDL